MFLSPRQEQEILCIARSYSVDGLPKDLVHDVITAVAHGEAEPPAMQIAEAARVGFICDGMIWFQERNEVDATTARSIIKQAKNDDMHDQDPPDEDAKAIEVADGLVSMAQTAWEQHVRGPEVEAILRLGDPNFSGGESNGQPAQSQAEHEQHQEGQDPQPDPEPDPESVETPPADSPDRVETEQPAESPEAQEDLSEIEPWEDYSKDKLTDIKTSIDAAVESYTEDELKDLLANVWAYEAAHKNRQGVMKKLEEVAEKIGVVAAATEAAGSQEEQREEDQPEPTPAPEASAGAEDSPGEGAEPDEPAASGAADSGDASGEEGSAPPASDDPPAPAAPAGSGDGGADPADSSRGGDRGGDQAYRALIDQVGQELADERLHIPPPPTDDVPNLPEDFTSMSDQELQKLYGVYGALAYRTAFEVQREDRIATHLRHHADELHRELLVNADKYDDHDKPKTMTILEAEIEQSDEIKRLRSQQRRHEIFAASKRQERDSYNKVTELLSRIHTMRQDEWERSQSKGGGSR